MMGKICERCFREYFEEDGLATPAEKLGRIFLGALQDQELLRSKSTFQYSRYLYLSISTTG